jgi:hypothetical protein
LLTEPRGGGRQTGRAGDPDARQSVGPPVPYQFTFEINLMWRFRGTPPYLAAQAKRLGISQVLADRCRHNPEIHRASVLLSQLCERLHRCRKEDGRAVLSPPERAQFRSTLEQIEQECAKLHALAAAAAEMIDEAWTACEAGPPNRHYIVLCDFDNAPTIPLPLGDGTATAGPAALTR